jgi:hypothetical protein
MQAAYGMSYVLAGRMELSVTFAKRKQQNKTKTKTKKKNASLAVLSVFTLRKHNDRRIVHSLGCAHPKSRILSITHCALMLNIFCTNYYMKHIFLTFSSCCRSFPIG